MASSLEGVVAQAFLVRARVSALMTFAPFFSNLSIPMRVRAGFTVALTALLYPVYAPRAVAPGEVNWWRVAGGEILVGLLLGLTLHFVFDGIQMAGEILGFQIGFSLTNLNDPQTQVDTPVLSTFHNALAPLIFIIVGVDHGLLRGLARSFELLPPGTASATEAVTSELLTLAGGILSIGLQIAAPILLATFLADLAPGYAGKAAPQLPVLFVGPSVKSLVGYAVLVGAVAFWPRVFEGHFRAALASTARLLAGAR